MSFRQRSTLVCAAIAAAAVALPTAPSAFAAAPAARAELNASCEGEVDWTANPGLSFTNQGSKSIGVRATFQCDVPKHPDITSVSFDYTVQATGGCPAGITTQVRGEKLRWNNGRTTDFDLDFQVSPLKYTAQNGRAVGGLFKGGTMQWSAEHIDLPVLNCLSAQGVTGGKMRKRFTITGGQDGNKPACKPKPVPRAAAAVREEHRTGRRH